MCQVAFSANYPAMFESELKKVQWQEDFAGRWNKMERKNFYEVSLMHY